MDLIVVLFFLLLVLGAWRYKHHAYVAMRFKYTLYNLRDRLRMLAIHGILSTDHWAFDYLDSTLSKSISKHKFLTLFSLVFLHRKYKDDKNLFQLSEQLELEFDKCPQLKEIQKEYTAAIAEYITEQHFVSYYVFIRPILAVVFGTKMLMNKISQYSNSALIYPETSISSDLSLN